MTARRSYGMMLITVVGMVVQCCRVDAGDRHQRDAGRRDLRIGVGTVIAGRPLHTDGRDAVKRSRGLYAGAVWYRWACSAAADLVEKSEARDGKFRRASNVSRSLIDGGPIQCLTGGGERDRRLACTWVNCVFRRFWPGVSVQSEGAVRRKVNAADRVSHQVEQSDAMVPLSQLALDRDGWFHLRSAS